MFKICRTLNNSGTPCSIKRVQRHMAQREMRSVMTVELAVEAIRNACLNIRDTEGIIPTVIWGVSTRARHLRLI